MCFSVHLRPLCRQRPTPVTTLQFSGGCRLHGRARGSSAPLLRLISAAIDPDASSIGIVAGGSEADSTLEAVLQALPSQSCSGEVVEEAEWREIQARIRSSLDCSPSSSGSTRALAIMLDMGLVPDISVWTSCIKDVVRHFSYAECKSWQGPQTAAAAQAAHQYISSQAGDAGSYSASQSEAPACKAYLILQPALDLAYAFTQLPLQSRSDSGTLVIMQLSQTPEVAQLLDSLQRLLKGMEFKREEDRDGWMATSLLPLYYLLALFSCDWALDTKLQLALPLQHLPVAWLMSHVWLTTDFEHTTYDCALDNTSTPMNNNDNRNNNNSSIDYDKTSMSRSRPRATLVSWSQMAMVVRWRALVAVQKRAASRARSSVAPGMQDRVTPFVFGVLSDVEDARDEWLDAFGDFVEHHGAVVADSKWSSDYQQAQTFETLSHLMEVGSCLTPLPAPLVEALNDVVLVHQQRMSLPQLDACLGSLTRMCENAAGRQGQEEEQEEAGLAAGAECEKMVEEIRYNWLWEHRHGVLRPDARSKLMVSLGERLSDGVVEKGSEIHVELQKRGLA